jgi:hypothetical protein
MPDELWVIDQEGGFRRGPVARNLPLLAGGGQVKLEWIPEKVSHLAHSVKIPIHPS